MFNDLNLEVYAGEYVAVIAVCGQSAYVEYNTSAGRKRGYVPYYNLDVKNSPVAWKSVYNSNGETDRASHAMYFAGSATVYAGPTSLYASIGSVSNETIYRYGGEIHIGPYNAYYIEYYVTGTTQVKSGFIVY